MVDAIGETSRTSSRVEAIMANKFTPWLLAFTGWLMLTLFESFTGGAAAQSQQMAELQSQLQQVQVELAIIKEQTAQMADTAQSRYTKGEQEIFSNEIDRRFSEIGRRLNDLEKER